MGLEVLNVIISRFFLVLGFSTSVLFFFCDNVDLALTADQTNPDAFASSVAADFALLCKH